MYKASNIRFPIFEIFFIFWGGGGKLYLSNFELVCQRSNFTIFMSCQTVLTAWWLNDFVI